MAQFLFAQIWPVSFMYDWLIKLISLLMEIWHTSQSILSEGSTISMLSS